MGTSIGGFRGFRGFGDLWVLGVLGDLEVLRDLGVKGFRAEGLRSPGFGGLEFRASGVRVRPLSRPSYVVPSIIIPYPKTIASPKPTTLELLGS